MTGFIIAAVIVIWLGAVAVCAIRAMEGYGWGWGVAAVLIFVLGIGFGIQQAINEQATGPCLREETGTAYNAATKTVMPYTRCVERGTWADQ